MALGCANALRRASGAVPLKTLRLPKAPISASAVSIRKLKHALTARVLQRGGGATSSRSIPEALLHFGAWANPTSGYRRRLRAGDDTRPNKAEATVVPAGTPTSRRRPRHISERAILRKTEVAKPSALASTQSRHKKMSTSALSERLPVTLRKCWSGHHPLCSLQSLATTHGVKSNCSECPLSCSPLSPAQACQAHSGCNNGLSPRAVITRSINSSNQLRILLQERTGLLATLPELHFPKTQPGSRPIQNLLLDGEVDHVPSRLIPSWTNMSNSASRNGGATLFFTTFTRIRCR